MRAAFFSNEAFKKSDDRRGKIALAMDACIREKGYAATTLTDIAVRAHMSPSHIRYYFETREEILEFYLGAICDQIIADIDAIPRKTPAQWIKDFISYFISNPEMNRTTVMLLVEIFAVSAHNAKLRKIKIRYDDFVRKTFVDFFKWVGTAPGIDPNDAAYRLWALEGGMKFNSMFQSDFSKEKAGNIFEEELKRLSGLGKDRASKK
ncbi:MAG TPA: TetR/AcrR family transcriptional regulator [Rhizomicrobium sp.]|jgi:AcrR family transcriptional regulator|nr:TetR/AcrR family transcriptional regulator [Rhizomicrobium sp.]